MQGYLIRNRRRAEEPEAEEIEDVNSATSKIVVASLAAVLFGSIFLFLELYGKCHCSAQVVGAFLLITGSLVLTVLCIKDLIMTMMTESAAEEFDTADLPL